MPTYDYQCRSCGHQIEHICRIAERPETLPCPSCKEGAMRQIITAPLVLEDDMVNVPWLRDFAAKHNRQGGKRDRFGGPPIQSRADYKRYLKEHNLRDHHSGTNITEI